jgi:uncharacterized membrane protein YheB (UPF0754 family)
VADLLGGVLADARENWLVYAAMPLFGALIGYVTKLLAIRMMFQPLEFRGVRPFLGWQGVIPRRAGRMASVACDMLMERLISPREILGRIDPDRLAAELRQPLTAAVDDITREVAAEYAPGLWESMPEPLRALLVRRVQAETPEVVAEVMAEVRRDPDAFLDIKSMVVTNLVRDKELLNRIFRESGDKEFTFIARSGIYFGFAIGCVQMVTWALTHNPWVLPLFGLFTGWFTDWLALKMIFHPRQQRRFGPVRWQGLFLARRREVAAQYGELIAREILTPSHLFEALLQGPLSDRVFQMVQRHVQRVVDEQSGPARPLLVLAVGSTRYQQMKRSVADGVMRRLPQTMVRAEDYAADAMDIHNTLVTKMQQLDDEQFEELIRPAFRQDEWILVSVGAVLGFLMGEFQVLVLLH